MAATFFNLKNLEMKKHILLLLLALVTFGASAQLTTSTFADRTIRMKTSLTSSVDSVVVTNAATAHLYAGFKVKKPTSIQVLIVATSGTVAGTMTLYGSNDGINWIALTDATSTPTITTYTVTNTGTYAIPQMAKFDLGFHNYAAYRLTHVGTGTMVSRFKAIVCY